MNIRSIIEILTLISVGLLFFNGSCNQPLVVYPINQAIKQPVKIIFDTDIAGDHDDVGAAAVLHSLSNSGEAEILAMTVSETGEGGRWGAPALAAINTFYGRPDIPIGVPDTGFRYDDIVYSKQIAEEFTYKLDTIWDATVLYRKVLSEQPDTSVVIVTVGYMTNITNLLQSKPDKYSDLDGVELVNKKVKRWVCMAGIFPEGGDECNASSDFTTTQYAISHWERPILFVGYKIGSKINSGMRLPYMSEPNPLQRAFEIATCRGCCNTSFDQAAVLAAVRNPLEYWNIVSSGYAITTGEYYDGLRWKVGKTKNHSYLVEKIPPVQLEDTIEDLMMDLPNSDKKSFFTLPLNNTIIVEKGKSFSYRLPYYSYSKNEIDIQYNNLPKWVSFINDSIFGQVPQSVKNDFEFQAVLFENNIPIDTVDVYLSINNKHQLVNNVRLASKGCNAISVKKMSLGEKIYPDRVFLLKNILGKYLDYTWVITPANDGHRYDLGDKFVTFTVNNSSTVFIGYDMNFIDLKPIWLDDWEDTGDEITDDSGNKFNIYKRIYEAGDVVLGNNTTIVNPLRLMYLIFVKENTYKI